MAVSQSVEPGLAVVTDRLYYVKALKIQLRISVKGDHNIRLSLSNEEFLIAPLVTSGFFLSRYNARGGSSCHQATSVSQFSRSSAI